MNGSSVLEYNCPCCSAGLQFSPGLQKLKCEYCDNEFDIETLSAYAESTSSEERTVFQWEQQQPAAFDEADSEQLHSFICQSCGGELITDENTAATFCPYCENPTIVESRLHGVLKPEGVIPFKKSKEDAMAAFLSLCKGKPLLPKIGRAHV